MLASTSIGLGGTWNRDGVIVFARGIGPLYRVPASGGEPVAITWREPPQLSHYFPQFLPDGQRFLINITVDKSTASTITIVTNWARALKK